jgi:hypothetical protein
VIFNHDDVLWSRNRQHILRRANGLGVHNYPLGVSQRLNCSLQ